MKKGGFIISILFLFFTQVILDLLPLFYEKNIQNPRFTFDVIYYCSSF